MNPTSHIGSSAEVQHAEYNSTCIDSGGHEDISVHLWSMIEFSHFLSKLALSAKLLAFVLGSLGSFCFHWNNTGSERAYTLSILVPWLRCVCFLTYLRSSDSRSIKNHLAWTTGSLIYVVYLARIVRFRIIHKCGVGID